MVESGMADVATSANAPMSVEFRDPIRMQAWLVTAENIHRVAAWCGGWVTDESSQFSVCIHFANHEDQGYAEIGDYVMKGPDNYFAVDAEYFARHYVTPEGRPNV